MNKDLKIKIIIDDYKCEADAWKKSVKLMQKGYRFCQEINTGGDEIAIICSNKDLTREEAQVEFDKKGK